MAKRNVSKVNKFERMFRILEYLKKHTDENNTTTQAKMRKVEEVAKYMGDKQTFNRLIKDMVWTMNSSENESIYKEDEWKICFNDFKKHYGDNDGDLEDDESNEDYETMHIADLYYKRTFSYSEINTLIEGVLSVRTIDTKTAHKLIKKIEDKLTTNFYRRHHKHICKIKEPELINKKLLEENLMIIQKAIDDKVQISFRFNGYTYKKKLEPVRGEKDVVSPYYIVANCGKCYLMACKENLYRRNLQKNMSIWRIDLMTDLDIPDTNKELGILGNRITPKNEVENLPLQWSDDFQLKHLNMAFDKPQIITLRINSGLIESNKEKRTRPNYTFLHDWFGDEFKYIKSEIETPYSDIIQVECSPYAMVNWAMQYSDRVEVIDPKDVRNAVIEKIRKVSEKYSLN